MKNAIIVHGMPPEEEYYNPDVATGSNFHWLPWLQKQLIVKDIKADTPEMPHSYLPVYDVWKTEFERFDITPETILVGHSCGAGFLVRWLSEHPDIKVGKVVLVAPYLDPDNTIGNGFFDFKIDSKLVFRTEGVTIFNSTDDDSSIHVSVDRLKEEIDGIKYVEFEKYGHFCGGDMKSLAFPELLDEILK